MLDQVLDEPPTHRPAVAGSERSGGRRPRWHLWRSRVAVVAVAFATAVTVLIGPTTTQDAARAFTIPPVVAAVGETGALPATILEMNPVGFGITAVAILGWLAYENRDTLGQWAHGLWDFLDGGNGQAGTAGGQSTVEAHPAVPKTREVWTMTKAGTGQLRVTGTTCTNLYIPPPGLSGNMCQGANWQGFGSGAFVYVCQSATATPRVIVGSSGTSTVSTTGWRDGVTRSVPSPTAIDKGTQDADGNSPGGVAFYVCPTGYDVVRASWYNTSTGSSADLAHGEWSSGTALPTDTRIDVTCKRRSDGSTYTVQGPITTDPGDGSAGIHEPACAPGDEVVSTTVNNRVAGDTVWGTTQTIPNVAAPDQVTSKPDCLDADGTGNGTCSLTVRVNGKLCTVGDVENCWDWKSMIQTGAQVDCVWGPSTNPAEYVVNLGDCDYLKEAYRTGKVGTGDGGQSWYSANPDGSPSPYAGNAPRPSTSPSTGGTGQPGNNPGGDPGTNTGADPDGGSGNCWSAFISWNPVDWVLTPVKCSFQWAFDPTSQGETMAEPLGKARDVLRGTAPGAMVDGFVTAAQSMPTNGSGSCLGPALTIDAPIAGHQTFHPFSACSEPMRTIAMIVKSLTTAGLVIASLFFGLRMLASTFGFQLPSGSKGAEEDGA